MKEMAKFSAKAVVFIIEIIITCLVCGFLLFIFPGMLLNGRISYQGVNFKLDYTETSLMLNAIIQSMIPGLIFTPLVLYYVYGKKNKVKSFLNCFAMFFISALIATIIFGVLISVTRGNPYAFVSYFVVYGILFMGLIANSSGEGDTMEVFLDKHRGSRIKIDNGEDESN